MATVSNKQTNIPTSMDKQSSNASFELDFLKTITLGEIIQDLGQDKRKLIALDKDMTVEDAMQVLAEEDILGAPVFDREQKCFVGMIEIFDIARWLALGYALERAYKDKEFER